MPRRKIPTKSELIRLQKLYKTDEKIAERLGNITPQLVAYWRRKKNIPRHSFPKFSFEEIRDLWERYGDDYRCGLELGLSKAAFYNWRRKYGIKNKPAFLKLEQLELNLGAVGSGAKKQSLDRQTIVQKIIAERISAEKVDVGDEFEIEPDLATININAKEVIDRFRKKNLSYVWNPNRIVISLDAGLNENDINKLNDQKEIREFVKKQNIKYFYDIDEGGCHQLVVEQGRILPGQFAVSSMRNCSSYGSIGVFSTCIDLNQMSELWSTRNVPLKVPSTVNVVINGKLPTGVFAKDLFLFISRKLNNGELTGKVIEFSGSTVSSMSVSERFTITSMTSALGAISSICPFDSITRRYLHRRSNMPFRPALADKDAEYDNSFEFNVEQLTPQIAETGNLEQIKSVAEISDLNINQIVIGSCVNGRFDDLRIAADILKGKKVHPDLRLFIVPSSRAVYLEALKKGLIRAFYESGAVVTNPGCHSCCEASQSLTADGEISLTTDGNLAGGSKPDTYIVSPATAAASAIRGLLTDPSTVMK